MAIVADTIQDEGGAVYHPQAYGAAGDGTTDDTAVFTTLIGTTIPASGGTIVVSRPYRLVSPSAAYLFPENVKLLFEEGGMLLPDPASGPTAATVLQIDGPVLAQPFQIFSATAAVRFGVKTAREVLPEWWGAQASDPAVDCGPALVAAVASLPAAGGSVRFGSGTYLVGNAVSIAATDVVFRGESRGQTVLQVLVPSGTFTAFDMITVAAGNRFLLRDLSILGPTGATVTNNAVVYAGFGSSPATPADGALRVHDVDISGNFLNAINGQGGSSISVAGEVVLELVRCDLSGYKNCVGWFTDNVKRRLHARDTYFHDAGLTSLDHLIYVDPTTSISFTNCRFSGLPNGGYAVHHYGSGTTAPDYAIFEGCVFAPTVSKAVLTSPFVATRFVGNEIRSMAGPVLRGPADLVGNRIQPVNDLPVSIFSGYVPSPVNIVGNTIDAHTPVGTSGAGSVWCIRDNYFLDSGGTVTSNGMITIGIGTGTRVTVEGNTFQLAGTREGIEAKSVAAGTVLDVRDNVFRGAGSACVHLESITTAVEVEVSRNRFEATAIPIRVTTSVTQPGLVRGEANVLGATAVSPGSTYHYLRNRDALSPSSVASTANLLLDPSYGIFRITATNTINNIYLSSAAATPMFAGRVTLLVGAAWSLSTAGNIKPASTAARAVDSVVTLVYDPSTAFWYEV